ncbi:MAG: base excision DNA repair protein [Candidatus Sulfotelmatobacter sp.]
MPSNDRESDIRVYYRALLRAWGPQHWWPANTRFEVIVGAYLTQNTSWTNVEHALNNLRAHRLLSVEGVRRLRLPELERLIRPSGYFRQKAKRLKGFIAFLDKEYDGSLTKLFAQPTDRLREQLLTLNGVGPETADSILLYAGNHPVFVVDAYTRRILDRHLLLPEEAGYEEIRKLFESALPPLVEHPDPLRPPASDSGARDGAHPPSPMSAAPRSALAQVYNEMHGLIVAVGKDYCRKSQPRCDQCPLQIFLPLSK